MHSYPIISYPLKNFRHKVKPSLTPISVKQISKKALGYTWNGYEKEREK